VQMSIDLDATDTAAERSPNSQQVKGVEEFLLLSGMLVVHV